MTQPVAPFQEVSREQAIQTLWLQGVLLWMVRPEQADVYAFLSAADGADHTIRLIYVHRQFGKSFLSLLVAVELALRKPFARIQVVAPTAKMLRAVLLPNMAKLLETCPEPLKPQFQALDSVYTFSNGSTIRLDGADSGNAETLRGRANDFVIVDEAGFVADLKTLIHDIILPSFVTTKGRLVLITTPPTTVGHYVTVLRRKLEPKGAFLRLRLSDNKAITPDQRKRWAEEAGGEDSTNYQREYECEEVTESGLGVLPEWDKKAQARLVREFPPPDPYASRLVSLDLGWTQENPSALLFGHYYFPTATLFIEDEAVLPPKARIGQIADEAKRKEALLWGARGGNPAVAPFTRISDIDPMVLAELAGQHSLPFRPVTKALKEQMVNSVRTWLKDGRIIVHPRCTQLIAQMEAAIWTDTGKRVFAHVDGFGHFDLLDCLVYMLQAVPRDFNPYPAMPEGLNPERMYIDPSAFPDPNTQPLRDLFRPVNARRRGIWGR